MGADPRLIVALDLPTVGEADTLVERLGGQVSFYKVGLELLATGGMALAKRLTGSGLSVFAGHPPGQLHAARGQQLQPDLVEAHLVAQPLDQGLGLADGRHVQGDDQAGVGGHGEASGVVSPRSQG